MIETIQTINLAELNLDPPTRELLQRLLNHIERLTAELNEVRAENQRLRDEIARLKGEKGKPEIKANRVAASGAGAEPKKATRCGSGGVSVERVLRAERIKIDREEVIKLDRSQLPSDVEHRGYREVVVQNIRLETDTVVYRLERLYSPSRGQLYEARLPEGLAGQSYGRELQALVIMLYFELRVPEEKILKLLGSQGIVISAGEISNILIKKHLEPFAQERKAVLRAGLETTDYQHIDDTGARVDGVNHYVMTLCNPYYTSFFTHRHKNQETVAGLLSVLDEPGEGGRAIGRAATEAGPSGVAADEATGGKTLRDSVPILVCDDAGQFHDQTEHRALCWVHEERHYKKLRPFFEAHQQWVDEFRRDLWKYYERLKAYQAAPTPEMKAELSAAFDELFSRTTGYEALDHRIALTRQKKRELLLVLEFPQVPLENNQAERAVREYVIKRKISNGTRTQEGSRAWDVFLSLLDTCRKNGVNFYGYLVDRISQSHQIPALDTLVLAHARASPG